MRKRKRLSNPDDKVLDLTCFELSDPICIAAETATAIAAGVSALASAGSGVAMMSKKRGTTRMLKVSKELADYNNQLARQNWQMENEYNSPAAQMQRYKEAGLNPNLIYGQQNTAGSIHTPEASLADASSVLQSGDRYSKALGQIANSASVYQNIMQGKANIDNTRATTDNVNADRQLKEAETLGREIQNRYQESMMQYQLEGLATQNAQNAFNLAQDRMFREQERRVGLLKSREEVANMSMDTTKKSKEIAKIDGEIGAIDQSIEQSKAVVDKIHADIALGFGNLGVAKGRLGVERGQFNLQSEKWNAVKEDVQNDATYRIFRRTGYFPENLNFWGKGMYLLNNLLDRIPFVNAVSAFKAGNE